MDVGQYTYLLLNIVTLLGPLALSFDKKVAFFPLMAITISCNLGYRHRFFDLGYLIYRIRNLAFQPGLCIRSLSFGITY